MALHPCWPACLTTFMTESLELHLEPKGPATHHQHQLCKSCFNRALSPRAWHLSPGLPNSQSCEYASLPPHVGHRSDKNVANAAEISATTWTEHHHLPRARKGHGKVRTDIHWGHLSLCEAEAPHWCQKARKGTSASEVLPAAWAAEREQEDRCVPRAPLALGVPAEDFLKADRWETGSRNE